MGLFTKAVVTALVTTLAVPVASTAIVVFSAEPAFAKGKDKDRGSKSDRGNKSRGGAKSEKPSGGKGAVRSVLKGANASNASARALEMASPNSRVGKAATYRDDTIVAVEKAEAAEAAAAAAEAHKANDPGFTVADTEATISGIEAELAGYTAKQEELDALNAKTELEEGDADRIAELVGELEGADEAIATAEGDLATAKADLEVAQAYEDELARLEEEAATAQTEADLAAEQQHNSLLELTDGRDITDNEAAMEELHGNLGL